MTTFRRFWIVLILAASVITSVVFTNIVERGDTSAWENPYEDWGKPNYALLGGQGNHFHSKSFAISPDAVAQTEEAFQQFDQHIWPESV